MFKIGDKVIDAYRAGYEGEVVTGTIRGRYRGHYLVHWEKGPRWRRYAHETVEDLLPVDSPAVPLLTDLGKRMVSLESEVERLDAEIKAAMKSAARGKQIERAGSPDQGPRSS